jgi:hypothetical protein
VRALIVACAALLSPAARGEPLTVAVGLGAGFQSRADFGTGTRGALATELVAHAYAPLRGRLHLRAGLRLGLVGLDQAEMPRAVRLEERDLAAGAEVGVVLDGVVVPSFSVGGALVTRFLRLELAPPVVGGGARTEVLPALHAQLGLGFPVAGGRVVFEPHVRRELVVGDDRIGWRIGADVTVTLF